MGATVGATVVASTVVAASVVAVTVGVSLAFTVGFSFVVTVGVSLVVTVTDACVAQSPTSAIGSSIFIFPFFICKEKFHHWFHHLSLVFEYLERPKQLIDHICRIIHISLLITDTQSIY